MVTACVSSVGNYIDTINRVISPIIDPIRGRRDFEKSNFGNCCWNLLSDCGFRFFVDFSAHILGCIKFNFMGVL